ncbi:MFS transporter [Streptomyces sp. TRM68367]|uniref:MFS transporter n=1 Tax=Streptomyces sp. TRM68367 TaxID=2758415 RepID=UPI00165C14E3|nr:MFS transporter [Streptomyces sp. TRM68367]MBC9724598.1 MFS transporter [Streptomyces sp. TRM68367]
MPAALHPAPVVDRPAHRDPNVLRWLGAYSASAIGDNIYYVALSWAAVQAGTPAQAGLVTAAGAVPRAVLMLGGGVVADRYGPRRVVLVSSAGRCLLVVVAAGLLLATSPGLWALGAVAVLFGVVDAVFLPAAGALPARITGPGQLARVQGMRGLATRLATVLGGPLAGLGIALGGTSGAFGSAALLIGVSLPVLWAVRVRPLPPDGRRARGGGLADGRRLRDGGWARSPALRGAARAHRCLPGGTSQALGHWGRHACARLAEAVPRRRRVRDGVLGELRDGVRHIRRDRVLRPLVLAIALGDLGFVGPMNLGLTLLSEERGWGSSGMGWVLGGFGIGAGAASLLLMVRGRVPRAALVSAVAEIAGCVAITGLAHAASVVAAACVALFIGLLSGLGGALRGALLQLRAGPAYVGRVISASTLVSFGVAPLTYPVVGWAIEAWGTAPVFAACAAICALGGVVTLSAGPLRRAELP